ncbi:MAG: TolC family protein [Verrucomicrobiota bacterium]
MKHRNFLAASALALLTNACVSTSPRKENPDIELPSQYTQSQQEGVEIKQSLLDLFQNRTLDSVVSTALENNPNLQAARARLDEVSYNFQGARSTRFPSLGASLSGGKNEPAGAASMDTYAANLDARWEIDIWGKLSDSVKASRADLAAAEADFQAAEQSLVGQTMQAWFTLVSNQKLAELERRRVASFVSTQSLVSRRFDLGEATLTELNLAQTDLENARADLERSDDLYNQAARQLKALMGEYPSHLDPGALDWPELNASVAADLPSELLTARPDVVSAYQNIVAADARFSATHKEIFPSFSLTANGGRSSSVLDDLADSAFNSWSALASFSVTLFDAGARRANTGAAEQRAEQAYYNYQSVVLNALREVEDAIGSEFYLAREESARLAALEAARQSLDRARRDYESGLITILSLLETQRRVFTTERQTINLKASRLNNRVSLALALGKGA